jgi:hypothetical protein
MTVRTLSEFGITLEEVISNRAKYPQTCTCSDRCFECDQVYICATCGQITPWCRGCFDEYEDSCDACACLLAKKAKGFLSDQVLDNDSWLFNL